MMYHAAGEQLGWGVVPGEVVGGSESTLPPGLESIPNPCLRCSSVGPSFSLNKDPVPSRLLATLGRWEREPHRDGTLRGFSAPSPSHTQNFLGGEQQQATTLTPSLI